MTGKARPDEFIDRVRAALDRSVARIDARTALRLEKARRQALAAARGARPPRLRPMRIALAAAAAGLLLLAAWPGIRRPPASPADNGLADVELLATHESPDFFNDLDFFTWLAEEMDHAG